MNIDRYTKTLLTLIALALITIAMRVSRPRQRSLSSG